METNTKKALRNTKNEFSSIIFWFEVLATLLGVFLSSGKKTNRRMSSEGLMFFCVYFDRLMLFRTLERTQCVTTAKASESVQLLSVNWKDRITFQKRTLAEKFMQDWMDCFLQVFKSEIISFKSYPKKLINIRKKYNAVIRLVSSFGLNEDNYYAVCVYFIEQCLHGKREKLSIIFWNYSWIEENTKILFKFYMTEQKQLLQGSYRK